MRCQEQVRRLDVAVNETVPMKSFQGTENHQGGLDGFAERKRLPGEPVGERFALQVLHDEEIKAVLPADVVEGADVRMVQTRSRPGLALESLSQVGIVGHMAGENFDRDGSVEPRVRGSIHFPHPTGTEVGMDFVRAEPRSGIE